MYPCALGDDDAHARIAGLDEHDVLAHAYFTLCVWASIALTCAPRIHSFSAQAAAPGEVRRDAIPHLVVHAGIRECERARARPD